MKKKYIACGIGTGIVDILTEVDNNFLEGLGYEKSRMTLVELNKQKEVLTKLNEKYLNMAPGGSIANSIAGFAELGGRTAMITKLGNDDYGNFIADDFRNLDIEVSSDLILSNSNTSCCVSLITPDAERTLLTNLDIMKEFKIKESELNLIKDSEYLLIEGYLLANGEDSCNSVFKAVETAKENNTQILMTLCDPFIVNCFEEPLRKILKDTDILFSNKDEACAYTRKNGVRDAISEMSSDFSQVVITDGEYGVWFSKDGEIQHCPSVKCDPVDLTGAGDSFLAGYLYGITNNFSPLESAKFATQMAKIVITKVGARMDGLGRQYLDSRPAPTT